CGVYASRCLRVHFYFMPLAAIVPCTLSLHDALPILAMASASARAAAGTSGPKSTQPSPKRARSSRRRTARSAPGRSILLMNTNRSEEHTSELQSRFDLVCRLLLEKKKTSIQSDNL